jgi:16S rRNA (guanine966-N2)-methyltransferase
LRIIGGNNKGRKIHVPHGINLRPTTDFAKESLFNILNNLVDFPGLEVLDLFAGTGSISYEFYSRGSNPVTAIEINPRCTDFIFRTAKQLNYSGLSVVKSEVLHFLKQTGQKWDVIFADPPYDYPYTLEVHHLVFKRKLLQSEGIFILEHDKSLDLKGETGFFDHRHYGKVNFSFFANRKNIGM